MQSCSKNVQTKCYMVMKANVIICELVRAVYFYYEADIKNTALKRLRKYLKSREIWQMPPVNTWFAITRDNHLIILLLTVDHFHAVCYMKNIWEIPELS